MSSPNILQQYIDYTINQEKLSNLCKSFTSALKSVDLHKATNMAAQIGVSADKEADRKILIQSGVISCMVEVIGSEYYHHDSLLVECTWILCNLAAGDSHDRAYLVELGALHKGLELMRHPCNEMQVNVVMLLANIAGNSIAYRDMLLDEGVADQIEWLLQSTIPQTSIMSNVAWLVAKLTRGRPYPNFEKVAILPKYLEYLMKNTEDINTLVSILKALYNFSRLDNNGESLRVLCELDIWTNIFDLARKEEFSEDLEILLPALGLINKMTTGNNNQVEMLVKNGFVGLYEELLQHPNDKIRKEVYFGLSKFLGNGPVRIQQVFDFKESEIIQRLIKASHPYATLQCLDCIEKICSYANIIQLCQLIKFYVIDLLCWTLNSSSEENILVSCLESLKHILNKFRDEPEFEKLRRSDIISMIERCGGLESLERLQTSEIGPTISPLVTYLIEEHINSGV